jgi:hypothetical protein
VLCLCICLLCWQVQSPSWMSVRLLFNGAQFSDVLLNPQWGGCWYHSSGKVKNFMNDCECRSLISSVTECLNSCRDRTNVSMCWGIMLKSNDTFSGINELHTAVMTCLTFVTEWSALLEHNLYTCLNTICTLVWTQFVHLFEHNFYTSLNTICTLGWTNFVHLFEHNLYTCNTNFYLQKLKSVFRHLPSVLLLATFTDT